MFALLAVIQTSSVAAQRASATVPELGQSIERELAGGQIHRYQTALARGEFLRIAVEQRGVDLVIKLQGSDAKLSLEFDSELRLHGVEEVEFVAETEGAYQLEVAAKFNAFPSGKYRLSLAERRPSTEKDRQLDTARRSSSESIRLRAAARYADAQELAEQVVATRERELGPTHLHTGLALQTLAKLHEDQGRYDAARSLAERVLNIREAALPTGHPDIGLSLNNLAIVLRLQEDLVGSISLHQRGLTIIEKSLGRGHPAVAVGLINLGVAYKLKGDLPKAEQAYRRAITIQERALSPEHRNVAVSANNLGLVYLDRGNYTAAGLMFRRALAILEKIVGSAHPSLSDPLMNLAKTHTMSGEYAAAETLFERALTLSEKSFDPSHPNTGTVLFNFASSLRFQGQADRASVLYKRALEIRETALGMEHPSVARVLDSIAILAESKGDVRGAVRAQERSAAITERALELNLAVGSERQRLAYLAALPEQTGQIISTALRSNEVPQAAELAATVLLQRKGRVQDALGGTLAATRRRSDPGDRLLLNELNETTAEIGKLVLGGSPEQRRKDDQHRIRSLEDRRQQIEEALSSRNPGFLPTSRPVTLASIQAALPPGAALVEFVVYRPLVLDASLFDQRLGKARYAALLVRRDERVKWWDLGDSAEIDSTVADLRQCLRDPKRRDTAELARLVDRKIMEPIRPSLRNTSQLFISPDGSLNLLPFAALVDQTGRYLVESHSLTYLTTGRDLLRLRSLRTNSGAPPLIIAAPEFGEPKEYQIARASSPLARRRRTVVTGAELSSVYFAPLPGTLQEARAIHALFPESVLLTGAKAAEGALKGGEAAPRILHIATHGFFLNDSAVLESDNPMLRSGLALAGANVRSGEHDGILTALEASGLDLRGTRLVTLSACDTGLGEVKNGEGVYGFRRALTLAGAETLVMSLWPVSDGVTRELMTAYYTGLKLRQGRGEALRQVQLKMLQRADRRHPFYWASFTQSGEWGNLDGVR